MSEKNYFLLVVKEELIALKEFFQENKFLFTCLLLVFFGGLYFIKPFPGKDIRIAAAGKDSAYTLIAKAQANFLQAKGVNLSIERAQNSVQSAKMLANSENGVNAAFIQGGVVSEDVANQIQSLGSVDFEPVWIFYRKGLAGHPDRLKDLAKLRVGLGPYQSGTWIIANKLFTLNNINVASDKNFKVDTYENNLADLLDGKLDALVNVNPATDPVVARLLRDPRVELFELTHATAYDKQLPFVKVVILPAASIDIENQIPPKDISLIATTTNLAVSKDMHPALQIMLLVASKDSQRVSRNLFLSNEEKFPTYMDSTIPISEAASNFYDYGMPQSMRYLPFWLAGFIDRVWVYILALLALIIPLSQLNLNLRATRFQMRIGAIQRELLRYEREVECGKIMPERQRAILARLDELSKTEAKQNIPAGSESEYFDFLARLSEVQSRISGRQAIDP
jgi:TRAP-type uncharacterized transport system substrate-binding protein